MMKSRERVRTALSHRTPDRLPIDFGGTFLTSAPVEMQQKIADILGIPGKPDYSLGHFDNRLQEYFGCDLRSLTPSNWPDWGFRDIHEAPMKEATIQDLQKYRWPVPDDSMILGAEQRAKELHNNTDYFICCSQITAGLFETSCWLRGYQQIMYDMALEPDFILALNEKLLEVTAPLSDLYFSAVGPYVDMVLLGDDLATQNGPYMSPEMFRKLYKPYFEEYIRTIKKHCPHAFIAHHCCGSSFRLLDDLADIGIQVINPVQTTAREMDVENLATKKDRLSFLGGVDLQYVLPFGTPEEVRAQVRELASVLGKDGGYILAACHSLPDDVKPENVITMLETAR